MIVTREQRGDPVGLVERDPRDREHDQQRRRDQGGAIFRVSTARAKNVRFFTKPADGASLIRERDGSERRIDKFEG